MPARGKRDFAMWLKSLLPLRFKPLPTLPLKREKLVSFSFSKNHTKSYLHQNTFMYSFALSLHSLFRWVVLVFLLVAIIDGYVGWKVKKAFTRPHHFLRITTLTVSHIQLLLGLYLYVLSPITQYFLNNFSESIHERQLRFFGMEHSSVMLVAISVLTIGSIKSKRRENDESKFKTMFIWCSIALLLILTSIPWEFSPLISRPSFRPF